MRSQIPSSSALTRTNDGESSEPQCIDRLIDPPLPRMADALDPRTDVDFVGEAEAGVAFRLPGYVPRDG